MPGFIRPGAAGNIASEAVALTFATAPSGVLPHVRAGKLRAIAVAAEKRTAAIPEMPTFGESGMPEFNSDSWYGILVPAGTPRDITAKLNAEIRRVLALGDVKQRLAAEGAEPMGNSPEEFAEQIRKDLARLSKVAREANVKVE